MAIIAHLRHNIQSIFFSLVLIAPVSASPAIEPSAFLANPALTAIPKAIPAPPRLGAKSYFLMDHNSDYEITGHNPDERVEPASLTKIMTHYVIESEVEQGHLKYTDFVHISPKAWKTQGSRMFTQVNSEVPAQELLKGIVIESGNDASVAIAEHISGTEEAFADLMNQHAERLGMTNTHFVNSTGLPHPNHYSSAKDMAILGQALIRDFPTGYALHAEKTYKYKNIEQHNRNKLLWRDPSVDGIKTGFTEAARYCLVASGKRKGMRLIAVVMGAKTDPIRTQETTALLNYGFRFYETELVFKAGEQLGLSRIWMGQDAALPLGVAEDLYVTVPKGHKPFLQTEIKIQDYLEAPIQQGQPFGEVKLALNDKLVTTKPLVALKEIGQANIIARASDQIKIWAYQFLNRKLNEVSR